MNSLLYAALLVAGLLCYWLARQTEAEPKVSVCHCGDLVRHLPGLPSWCPTCGRVLL